MEKSIIEQRLELAKSLKGTKVTRRNEPNIKLIAQAIYNHVHYSDL
jgi:hypothetical protein